VRRLDGALCFDRSTRYESGVKALRASCSRGDAARRRTLKDND